MNSRQVQFVLIALIALGIVAVLVRLVATGGDGTRLTGLLPISPDIVDQVVLRTGDEEVRIHKIGDGPADWRVGQYDVYVDFFAEFWATVDRFDGAQLISTNPSHHTRMGVSQENGVELLFMLGNAVQERFIVGVSSDETVAMCYLRRQDENNTYGVPCRVSNLFEPDPSTWRDPIIMEMPLELIGSFTLRYPSVDVNAAVEISVENNQPIIILPGAEVLPANPQVVAGVLTGLRNLLANDFATDAEARTLNFDVPDASVLIRPIEGVPAPPLRLSFLQRDAETYWVRNLAGSTVYIVNRLRVEPILVEFEEFLTTTATP